MYTWGAAEEVREVWLGGDVKGGGVLYTWGAAEEVREVWLGGGVMLRVGDVYLGGSGGGDRGVAGGVMLRGG